MPKVATEAGGSGRPTDISHGPRGAGTTPPPPSGPSRPNAGKGTAPLTGNGTSQDSFAITGHLTRRQEHSRREGFERTRAGGRTRPDSGHMCSTGKSVTLTFASTKPPGQRLDAVTECFTWPLSASRALGGEVAAHEGRLGQPVLLVLLSKAGDLGKVYGRSPGRQQSCATATKASFARVSSSGLS